MDEATRFPSYFPQNAGWFSLIKRNKSTPHPSLGTFLRHKQFPRNVQPAVKQKPKKCTVANTFPGLPGVPEKTRSCVTTPTTREDMGPETFRGRRSLRPETFRIP